MMKQWKYLRWALLAGFGGAVLSRQYGQHHWLQKTHHLEQKLYRQNTALPQQKFEASELAQLPEPVRRYFNLVLVEGQPIIAQARFEHRGQFNLNGADVKWKPFRSKQLVVANAPGFVWNGHIQMAPGLPVFVHDAYVQGNGILQAKLLGLVTMAENRNTLEMAESELMRYLAEGVWYPTRLLPSQGVRWEAIDAKSAQASLTDGKTLASLVFYFNNSGLIEGMRAEARHRALDKGYEKTPWQGKVWDYATRGGMRIPLSGEIGWVLSTGYAPYWRGKIEWIEYHFT